MSSSRGVAAATGAYIIWGLLPVYWKLLINISPYEIMAHRMVWSFFVTLTVLIVCRRLHVFLRLLKDWRILLHFACSGSLLGLNWLIYIGAVNTGFIVEASLGYYINPLVTVVFAVLFMQERMRLGQVCALILAALGVIYLTLVYGRFPWIALALAGTFAVYGLLHKKTHVGPLEGLCLETLAFFLPAAALLTASELQGNAGFGHVGLATTLLLAGTGIVTTIPLLLFSFAAQAIPLSLLGVLQYTAPTLNLLLGVFIYAEEFPESRLIGFILVWAGLLLFLAEGWQSKVRRKRERLAG